MPAARALCRQKDAVFARHATIHEMSRPIARFLSGEELRELQHAPRRLFLHLAPIYVALVLVFVGLHAVLASGPSWVGWIAYPVAFLAVGWCQYAIVQALHEGAHQVLGKKDLASRIASALMTYPLALTVQFRGQHLEHHRHFGDPERDPDFYGYGHFPESKLALLGHLALNATGLPALVSFLRKSSDAAALAELGTTPTVELLRLATAQLVLLLVFSATFGPLTYIFLWALPLVTLVKLGTAIRLLCEHGSPDQPFVWRTFAGGFVQRNLLGAFGLCYHAEHHAYPTIPYENLPRAYALHVAARESGRIPSGPDDPRYEIYPGGHLGLLRDWLRELPLVARVPSTTTSPS